MERIPFNIVQNAIDDICSLTEEAELEKASEHLLDSQPELGEFFLSFIEDMSENAQDLGFMMALILHRSFEDQYPSLRAISEDEVITRFEKAEVELEKYLKISDNMVQELQEQALRDGQPQIVNYLIEELFMAPDLEPTLAPEEQVHLFIICKFFADCLHFLALETAPENRRH